MATSVKVKLDTDLGVDDRVKYQNESLFKTDLHRYPGEKIIFNSVEVPGSAIQKGGNYGQARAILDDAILKHLGIEAGSSVAVDRILRGFHQEGFSTVTLSAVVEVAQLNGYFPLVAGKAYTAEEIKRYETAGYKPVETRIWHEMNTENGSDNILVTEHVQMLYQGEVCGTFKSKTRFDASGGAEYLGTEMELTGEGKKIIPDTRSLLTKIVEAVKKVFNKITHQDPPVSAFNFFAAKQNSERQQQPGPVDERTPLLT